MHSALRLLWLGFLIGLVIHLSHRRDVGGILAIGGMVAASLVAAYVATNREKSS